MSLKKPIGNTVRSWLAIAPMVFIAQISFCQEPSEGDQPIRPPQLPSEFAEPLNDEQDTVKTVSESIVGAEIDGNTSLESISEAVVDLAGEANTDLPSLEAPSTKILNENTPEWVKNGLVLGEDHRLAISSSLFPDREQCAEDLKSRLMNEVRSYLDKHVLELTNSAQLPELTQEYVESHWVVANRVFDNVQDRASGTYHQLWMELRISSEQLEVVRGWEKSQIRETRTKQVGVLGGLGIAAITVFSGLIGVLARREKAKLKK